MLNVVSSWWADEARQYGLQFDQHDDRYARTSEWLDVVHGPWSQDQFDFDGRFYRTEGAIYTPRPVSEPIVYAGGESEAEAKRELGRITTVADLSAGDANFDHWCRARSWSTR